jgi:hypothetical protein
VTAEGADYATSINSTPPMLRNNMLLAGVAITRLLSAVEAYGRLAALRFFKAELL